MTYPKMNDLLNEADLTPEDMIARKEARLDRARLQKAGVFKDIAKKILAKPQGR